MIGKTVGHFHIKAQVQVAAARDASRASRTLKGA